MNLVTVEEACEHLRFDDTANDLWLELFIPAVSHAVIEWLGDVERVYRYEEDTEGNLVPVIDSNGDPAINPIVKAAVLNEIALREKYRAGEGGGDVQPHWGYGYVLGIGATSLLTCLRKSRLA